LPDWHRLLLARFDVKSSVARLSREPKVLMIVDTEPFASHSLIGAFTPRFDQVLYAPSIRAAEFLLGGERVTHILVCDSGQREKTGAIFERVPGWRRTHPAVGRVVALSSVGLLTTYTPSQVDYVIDQTADSEEILAVIEG
jgi:hypothetical protein